ncbi:protease prsW family-domain-containing protein [Hypoxylon crocopeplum]|nr:protease prsW family-domain-containing protein [Hypoxylon crocopeplum]
MPSNQYPLSRSTKILLWAVLPALFIAIGISSPLTAALSVFILAPTFYLLRHDRAQPAEQRTDPETFIWTYILTGTVGTFIVIIIQSALSYLLALVLFQSSTSEYLKEVQRGEDEVANLDAETLATRQRMAGRWQYWAFMLLFAYLAAALPEEALKYYGVAYARRRGRLAHERNYMTLGAAAALGFSTVENIGFLYAAASEGQGLGKLALTLVERVVVGSPMHVMGGLLSGLAASRRDFRGEDLSLVQIIGLPVLIHGAWDFSLFATSALDGNVGWVHPRGKSLVAILGLAVTIQGTLAFVVRKKFISWKVHEKKSK